MVAQKRARGGKAGQAAKKQAAAAQLTEDLRAEEALLEGPMETTSENIEQPEQAEGGEPSAETGGEEQAQEADQTQENPESEQQPEEKQEEKVESGKLLVENLPASYLFDYQEKLKELFSKHGEVIGVKRGPIIVTELTTTPTLSAIVEFKNRESLEKALSEQGAVLGGRAVQLAAEARADTAVLVGVPYEAGSDYVRQLFAQCGAVAHIHEFSKTKYKILRVTFHEKEAVEAALKLDRELRINGFLVTVSKYRDEDEQKAHSASLNKNKRQHSQQSSRNVAANNGNNSSPAGSAARNNFRNNARGPNNNFNARGNFRGAGGGRGGRGFGRGFGRGGYSPLNSYLPPPQAFMGRPGNNFTDFSDQGGFMNDGQRPNKRLRQM